MRREGLFYGIAFVGIVAAGAFLIIPRVKSLRRGPAETDRVPIGDSPVADRPDAATPDSPGPTTPPPPEPTWVTVTVEGPRGPLRGPLKPAAGAETRLDPDRDLARPRVEVLQGESPAWFGAVGHQWVRVEPAALREGMKVVLPEAAPPVVVRVREADGSPAARVPVSVRPTSPGPPRRTDGGGALVIDDAMPGLLEVAVGGSERAAPVVRVVAGKDRDVRVVLEPPWRVTGRVVDGSGSPIAGARVEGFGSAGALGACPAADADGRFTWTGPVASTLSIRVSDGKHGEVALEVAPPAVGDLVTDAGTVAMAEAGVTLDGHVRAAWVGPDARVSVEPAVAALLREIFGSDEILDAPRTAALAADGSFRLDGLPPGIPLRVSVRGAGVPVDAIVTGKPGEQVEVKIEPAAGETLEGHVIDGEGGAPAGGIRILASREPIDGDQELAGDLRAVTDAAGRFVLKGLLPGPSFLRAYVPGRRSLLARVDLPHAGPLAMRLEPAITDDTRRIAGVVVDDEGTPLAGVTLRAAGVVTRTGPDGSFRLEGVESVSARLVLAYGYEPGPLEAGADPGPHAVPASADAVPGGPPLRLVLPRDAAIAAHVLDGIDDRPIASAHVVVRTDDGRTVVDRGFALKDGLLALPGLPPRGSSVAILAEGRRYVRNVPLGPVERDGKPRDLGDVRLAHGIRVTGTILGPAGAPVPGARIAAMDEGWLANRTGDPTLRRDLALRRAVAGPDGQFVVEGLDPQRPILLAAWAPGMAPTLKRVNLEDFENDVEAKAAVRLARGGYLNLLLLIQGSKDPVVGALVDLESARTGADYLDLLHRGGLAGHVGATDEWRFASEHFLIEQREEGTYVVGPIEPGEYELVVERPGYHRVKRKIPVLDPGDVLVDPVQGLFGRTAGSTARLVLEMTPR